MKLVKAENSGAVHHLDRFFVYGVNSTQILEGHYNVEAAKRACDILNNHNIVNRHAERFKFANKKEIEIID